MKEKTPKMSKKVWKLIVELVKNNVKNLTLYTLASSGGQER
jgi:hypothetical protein